MGAECRRRIETQQTINEWALHTFGTCSGERAIYRMFSSKVCIKLYRGYNLKGNMKRDYCEGTDEEKEKWIVSHIKVEFRNGYRELFNLPLNENDSPVGGDKK